MNSVRETHVEGHLCRQVVRYGGLAIKLKPYLRGLPDRAVYWPQGVHDIIETKRPKGGRWEPLQQRWHAKLRKLGHNVFVLLTKEAVNEYIESRASVHRWGVRTDGAGRHRTAVVRRVA